jgi:hypothetical protein
METFLGEIPSMALTQLLVRFVREGYMETEDERIARLRKVNVLQKVKKK